MTANPELWSPSLPMGMGGEGRAGSTAALPALARRGEGGQLQRLRTARASARIEELILQLKKHFTIVIVTHNRHRIVAAKSLERIADHAKNIAEEAVYLCEAQDIRHASRN